MNRINLIHYNVQRLANESKKPIDAIHEQLAATSLMSYQNRQALDMILAEKNGVCHMFGESCCTIIPNNTAPDGRLTKSLNKLKALAVEMKAQSGVSEGITGWLDAKFGKFGKLLGQMFFGMIIAVSIFIVARCCCIPFMRGLTERTINAAVSREPPKYQAMVFAEMGCPGEGGESSHFCPNRCQYQGSRRTRCQWCEYNGGRTGGCGGMVVTSKGLEWADGHKHSHGPDGVCRSCIRYECPVCGKLPCKEVEREEWEELRFQKNEQKGKPWDFNVTYQRLCKNMKSKWDRQRARYKKPSKKSGKMNFSRLQGACRGRPNIKRRAEEDHLYIEMESWPLGAARPNRAVANVYVPEPKRIRWPIRHPLADPDEEGPRTDPEGAEARDGDDYHIVY